MVPERFSIEYPKRCLELLDTCEIEARQRHLIGSFSLLVATAVFTIPYERLKRNHPLARPADNPLYDALRRVERQKFAVAEFWKGICPDGWRFSRIMTHPSCTHAWKDQDGIHPMHPEAKNLIGARTSDDVLRVIRNALAHGNVIYLDENGFERRGATVQYLAFLSRYEERVKQRDAANTYRLVAVTEEGFLTFVKAWALWLESLPADYRLIFSSRAA